MSPLILFKPDEKIKWICAYDSNRKYFVTAFLTEKYDDVRFFRACDMELLDSWRKEMIAQDWVQIDGQFDDDILTIMADKSPVHDTNTNTLSETEIKELYAKYKIEND